MWTSFCRVFSDSIFDLLSARRSSHFDFGGFIGPVHKSGGHHSLEDLSIVQRSAVMF